MNAKITSVVAALALSAALAFPETASAQVPGGMAPTLPQDTAGRRGTTQPAPTPAPPTTQPTPAPTTTQPAPAPTAQHPTAAQDTVDNGPDPAASVSPTARTKYPAIVNAMHALWLARGQLRHGAHIFGGHRVKAIKAVNDAIDELHAALRYADKRDNRTAKRTP